MYLFFIITHLPFAKTRKRNNPILAFLSVTGIVAMQEHRFQPPVNMYPVVQFMRIFAKTERNLLKQVIRIFFRRTFLEA